MRATRTLMLLVLVAMGLALAGLAQAEWKFSGYTQMRYNFWDNDLDKGDAFDIRRARIKAEGPVSEATTFKIQLDLAKLDDSGGGEVELKDLLLTRTINEQWKGTLGFTSVPFGFEVPTSSSKRLPLERSQAANKLFPGERDTGLYLHYTPENKRAPGVVFGLSNGMAKWYEADKSGNEDTDSWALMARLQWHLPNNGCAGLSYRLADRTREVGGEDENYDDDLLGLHLRYNFPSNWALQAEYYDGTDMDVDESWWNGQAEYALSSCPVTVFYRHDVYDFGGTDDFTRHTIGGGWDFDKNERVTVQIEDYDDGKGGSFTNGAVQYQIMY